jgi:hypothetical protein
MPSEAWCNAVAAAQVVLPTPPLPANITTLCLSLQWARLSVNCNLLIHNHGIRAEKSRKLKSGVLLNKEKFHAISQR